MNNMLIRVPGKVQNGQILSTNENLGAWICRWGDGASQPHLPTQMSQGKPKQLSQKAFHWLPGESLTNDIITLQHTSPQNEKLFHKLLDI